MRGREALKRATEKAGGWAPHSQQKFHSFPSPSSWEAQRLGLTNGPAEEGGAGRKGLSYWILGEAVVCYRGDSGLLNNNTRSHKLDLTHVPALPVTRVYYLSSS